ncbi:MAG: exopolysaccharide biosynthesis protein [Chromatiales bacterium 21-64-14]|nr:MAG: exopolysaccharide biosynthesis protein [Chromatiales bacterium 21-64-14]HQU14858.1 CpsD/CapB family tyrosine-protein kinase [Gammaproteobacteria bacterium]
MERIKEALEKARQERLAGGGLVAGRPTATPPGQIVYSQTRTVEIARALLRENRVVAGLEPGGLADGYIDAYKILRTQVLQRLGQNGWNSLAVTSPGAQEGKTLTAVNLAISLAMEVNYTVLLVDANLRHPSVHKLFGLEPEYGLSDYLTGAVPIEQILLHPADIGRFVILPGGKPLINSAEMLNSPKMTQLVEEFKTRYPSRIVIFDLAPLLSAADALAFAPYVDAALLVVEEGATQDEELDRAAALLKDTQLIGTVLNKAQRAMDEEDAPHKSWLRRLFAGST